MPGSESGMSSEMDFGGTGMCTHSLVDSVYKDMEKKMFRASALQNLLYEQSVSGSKFCDVTLNFNGNVMKAHWCVLVGCPYFQAMYRFNSHKEASPEGLVSLNFGDPLVMEAAVKYLYTGEVMLSMDRLESYLAVADYLQIADLTDVCSSFLDEVVLTEKNCVQIMLMSSLYELDRYAEALRFVCGHLPQLLNGEDLLDLTDTSVALLLTDPTLSFVDRHQFFNFIVSWTERDKKKRMKHFPALFSHLDLQLVYPHVLENIIKGHPMVMSSRACQVKVRQAQTCVAKELAPDGTMMTDVLLLCGGAKDIPYRYQYLTSHLSSQILLAYLIREERWARLPDLPYGIRRPLMTLTQQGTLLVLDAVQYGLKKRPKEILRFHPRAKKWDTLQVSWPDSNYDHEFHHMLSFEGRLVFVASCKTISPCQRSQPPRGNKHQGQQASFECYVSHCVQLLEMDPDNNELRVIFTFFQRSLNSDIRVACSQHRTSTALDGGTLFVLGTKCFGYRDIPRRNGKKMLVYYDLCQGHGREVTSRKNAPVPNEPMAVVLPEGLVSVRPGKVNRSMVLVRDKRLVSGQDYTVPLLPVFSTRSDFAHTAVDHDLYVLGGSENHTLQVLTSVARFTFGAKQWTELESLPLPMAGAAVTRGRIPLDLLRCHFRCPHCTFQPGATKAAYDDSLVDDNSVTGDMDMDTSYYYYDSDSASDMHYAASNSVDDWDDWF